MGVEGSAARRPRFNSFNTMRGSHFRLITLGGLELARSDGERDETLAGLNARRRKVALLTVLALSRRSISRDVLVEMFWGDQDEARARHSLSDAVSHLRRVLGRDSIIATRSDIALAPNAPLVTDALRLAEVTASAEGAGDSVTVSSADELLALYGGPFLSGVYVEGSPSFEQWVTQERARLERLFVRTIRARCKAFAETREQAASREALAERWLEVDPLSAEAAVTYFEALASTDDALGQVLPAYERLRARLRREYDVEPDPSVSAVVANVKARRHEPILHHPSNAPTINLPPAPRGLTPRAAAGLLAPVLIAAAFVVGANRSASTTPPSRSSTVVAIAAIGSAGPGPALAEIETPSVSAYQHFTRYAQIASEGRPSEAIPELDAAIAIDSGFTAALLARLVHATQSNEHDVVATLNTALRKRGNRVYANAGRWTEHVRLLAYRQRYDEAFRAMHRAIALSDGEPSIALQLGWIFVMARRLESADSLVAAWNASAVHTRHSTR